MGGESVPGTSPQERRQLLRRASSTVSSVRRWLRIAIDHSLILGSISEGIRMHDLVRDYAGRQTNRRVAQGRWSGGDSAPCLLSDPRRRPPPRRLCRPRTGEHGGVTAEKRRGALPVLCGTGAALPPLQSLPRRHANCHHPVARSTRELTSRPARRGAADIRAANWRPRGSISVLWSTKREQGVYINMLEPRVSRVEATRPNTPTIAR